MSNNINIYIPIGNINHINKYILSPLSDYNINLIYEKGIKNHQTEIPRQRDYFESIKKQKNKILKLGSEGGEEYFIMQDSDVEHLANGIELLIREISKSDCSAVGIWPYFSEKTSSGRHVSSSCMIIKSSAVKNVYLNYNSGCFCSALVSYLNKNNMKTKYLNNQDLIKLRR